MQTPWGEIAVADAHMHFFSRRFFAGMGAQCGKTAEQTAEALGWTLPAEDPAALARQWLEEMNQQGVARAALIASIPGDEASVEAAVSSCRDRFFGYFMVDPTAEGAPERAALALRCGLHAPCLFPAMHRYSIQDARAQAVLDSVQTAGGRAVFVHCGVLTVGIRRKLGLPCPFDMRYSNPLDLHAVAARYPGIKFILPHFGAGFLREALMLTDLCPNVLLDTSSSNSWMRYEGLELKSVFRRVMDSAGPSRLLFGTDSSFFPRGWNYEVYEAQQRALLDLGISSSDARLMLERNLSDLFAA